MICKEYKCIFVHIPKTAGQSVEYFFLRLLGLSWQQRTPLLLRFNADPRLGPERLAHLTAEEYVRCGHIDQIQFASFFKFSFVRNPWARLVSEYRYRNYVNRISFKDFLTKGLPPAGPSDAYRHIVPQYDFLHDSKGRLLVDFVGRFENLQDDFDIVCSRLGITESTLPHVNQSKPGHGSLAGQSGPASHYSDYYDEETRGLVATMYSKDIDAFGYEFGK